MWTSDRRLWLTADRERVVEDGDPDAAYLLVSEGGELSDAEAERYGLRSDTKAKTKERETPAETKEVERPANTKARRTKKADE